MIRVAWLFINALQGCFYVAWTLICVSSALLVLVIRRDRRVSLSMARRLYSPGLLAASGVRLEISGLESVDFSRPSVFVANHDSMIDIPVIFAALPCNLHFVLKKELRWWPFIGWYAWAMGMIFVDRRDRTDAIKSLRRVGALIKGGKNVIAFPEGTRSRGRGVLPFKKGVFIAAIEAGVPVVPVAIVGAGAVLPSDTFRLRPGTVQVRIGQPIETANLTAEHRNELPEQARSRVIELLEKTSPSDT